MLAPTWDIAADLSGTAGKAWRWELSDEDRAHPDCAALVDQWLIHQPGSHPFWSWYVLSMVHLRGEVRGVPAVKQHPDMEYELLVVALNPDAAIPAPRGIPGHKGVPTLPYMTPIDQCEQFGALPGGDSKAREFCELIVLSVVDGRLVCDVDHRGAWSSMVAATVQHIREGKH